MDGVQMGMGLFKYNCHLDCMSYAFFDIGEMYWG